MLDRCTMEDVDHVETHNDKLGLYNILCSNFVVFYILLYCVTLYLGSPRWTCTMERFIWDILDELYYNIMIIFYVII